MAEIFIPNEDAATTLYSYSLPTDLQRQVHQRLAADRGRPLIRRDLAERRRIAEIHRQRGVSLADVDGKRIDIPPLEQAYAGRYSSSR